MSTVKPAGQLDELLLARGLIEAEQLEDARDQAAHTGRSLGRVLIELGYVTEAGLVSILAEQLGLEFVDLDEVQLDTSAISIVPEATAKRHNCIPVRFEDEGRLVLAMADPANVVAVDDVRAITGRVDLVHLNNSRDPAGSSRDRHAPLTGGEIPWELLADVARAADCPIVLETPGDAPAHAEEIALVREVLSA